MECCLQGRLAQHKQLVMKVQSNTGESVAFSLFPTTQFPNGQRTTRWPSTCLPPELQSNAKASELHCCNVPWNNVFKKNAHTAVTEATLCSFLLAPFENHNHTLLVLICKNTRLKIQNCCILILSVLNAYWKLDVLWYSVRMFVNFLLSRPELLSLSDNLTKFHTQVHHY